MPVTLEDDYEPSGWVKDMLSGKDSKKCINVDKSALNTMQNVVEELRKHVPINAKILSKSRLELMKINIRCPTK